MLNTIAKCFPSVFTFQLVLQFIRLVDYIISFIVLFVVLYLFIGFWADKHILAMGASGIVTNPYSSHVVERDDKSSNAKLHSDLTADEMQVNPISGDLSLIHVKLEHSWSSVQAFVVEHMAVKDLDLDWSKEVVGLNGFRYVGCNDLRDTALSSLHMFFKTAVEMLSREGYNEDAILNAILDSALCYQFDGPITKIAENARTLLQNINQADYSRSENVDADLHMLGLYILCKASSLLKTYYPFFTWGDALWCILLCDMDISIARDVSICINSYGIGQSEGLSVSQSDLREDQDNANEVSEECGCSGTESPAEFEPPQFEAVQRSWSNILTNYIVWIQRTATKSQDAPSGQYENSSLPRVVVPHNKKGTKGSRCKKNSNSMKCQKDLSKEHMLVKNVPQAKGIGKTCSKILKESKNKSLMAFLESAESTLTGPSEVATEKGLQTSTLVPTQPLTRFFSVKRDSTAPVTTGRSLLLLVISPMHHLTQN
jgi:hypothetical protein